LNIPIDYGVKKSIWEPLHKFATIRTIIVHVRCSFLLPLPLWIAQTAITPFAMRFNRKRQAFSLAFIPFISLYDEVAQMLQYLICVSRDTPFPGAHFEQVTEQRLGTRLHGARIESH